MTTVSDSIRMLLVDDETEFLDAVKPGLERRGFVVTPAENGHAALQLLSREAFDVVVLDVKMPGIDGVDTFRTIKRTAPQLPVILLTGHGNLQQAFETSREGVYEYLAKPCDIDELARVARSAVDRRAVTQAAPVADVDKEEIRLLLVDDDRDFVEAVARSLEKRGIFVRPAFGGHEALEAVRTESFHVAVVDVLMPDLDGLAVLAELRQSDPLLEVIVLSGQPAVEDVRRSLRNGAFDFLTKPQPIEGLVSGIRAAYERRRRRSDEERRDDMERILTRQPDF